MKHWTLPTILGIALGILGVLGLIELRPQMGVEVREPLENSQPFSVPFIVRNTGYFSFWVEKASCDMPEVVVGGTTLKGFSMFHQAELNHSLDRADGLTVICNFAHGPVKDAHIAIIVRYRPWESFPWTYERRFPFIGSHIDNWEWTPLPVDAEKD